MSFLYEMHLHTDESSVCGQSKAMEYIPYYQQRGYAGIFVTDHFYGSCSYVPDRRLPWKEQVKRFCRGYEEARNEGEKRGFQVFFGLEQCFESDECLIYGVDAAWLAEHPQIKQWNRRELFDAVETAGGCVVHAHPFRIRDYVHRIILNRNVHAVEAFNRGNDTLSDTFAYAWCQREHLLMTAGSDIHRAEPGVEAPYGMAFDRVLESGEAFAKLIRSGVQAELCVPSYRKKQPTGRITLPCEERDRQDRPRPFDPSGLMASE